MFRHGGWLRSLHVYATAALRTPTQTRQTQFTGSVAFGRDWQTAGGGLLVLQLTGEPASDEADSEDDESEQDGDDDSDAETMWSAVDARFTAPAAAAPRLARAVRVRRRWSLNQLSIADAETRRATTN